MVSNVREHLTAKLLAKGKWWSSEEWCRNSQLPTWLILVTVILGTTIPTPWHLYNIVIYTWLSSSVHCTCMSFQFAVVGSLVWQDHATLPLATVAGLVVVVVVVLVVVRWSMCRAMTKSRSYNGTFSQLIHGCLALPLILWLQSKWTIHIN